MLGAQLALTMPAARNALSPVNELETLGGQVEDGFKLGEITLKLVGIEPSKDKNTDKRRGCCFVCSKADQYNRKQ